MKKYIRKDNELIDPFIEDKMNKLTVEVPFEILSNSELSLNEKLLLGLDFSFKSKLGFNQLTNKNVAELFSIHPNIVGSCRKKLVEMNYLIRQGRKYFLTDHYKSAEKSEENHGSIENRDRRNIKIPFEIYSNTALKTGEKLLWGEYNSISKGEKKYFASREYTANRLSVSVESVSNWTKSLYEKDLFEDYVVISGYCSHQRRIITYRFDEK